MQVLFSYSLNWMSKTTMALTPHQLEQISLMMNEFVAAHRPPPEVRSQLDLGWRSEGQSVVLYDLRPIYTREHEVAHYDFAKATWVQAQKHWKIFWLRANGNWNGYEPLLTAGNLKRFLLEVEKDPYGCFKG